jgi:hypothetical protein
LSIGGARGYPRGTAGVKAVDFADGYTTSVAERLVAGRAQSGDAFEGSFGATVVGFPFNSERQDTKNAKESVLSLAFLAS